MSTPIADMVDGMVAKGASAEAIAVAVRAFEESVTRNAASRDASRSVTIPERSKAAVRAARYRENRKKNQTLAKANDVAIADSQSVTTERDASRDGVTMRCNISSLPLQTFDEVKVKKEVVTRARGTRITEDWQPSREMADFARGLGLDPKLLRDEFVDYWIAVPGSRGLKLDWNKTYRNRAREVAGRRRGSPIANRNNVIDAADSLIETMRQWERRDEPDMLEDLCGGAGAPDVRLLPAK